MSAEFILASASPRRLDLLRQIGIDAIVDPSGLDESLPEGTLPTDGARQLALAKALAVARRHPHSSVLVLGADTVVSVDGTILGKPTDDADATAMWNALRGRTHDVHTGVAVVAAATGEHRSAVATTRVTMRHATDVEIESYIATGEANDAAGSYAIQGRAAVFVERIDGDYSNVVGLPLPIVTELLHQVGFAVSEQWQRR